MARGHTSQKPSAHAPAESEADTSEDGVASTEADPTTTTTTTTDGDANGDDAGESTLLLEEGSTGGAGLRGLQGEEPEPLTASILYFDSETRRLVAYDRITVAWLQEAGATIERHMVDRELGSEPAG